MNMLNRYYPHVIPALALRATFVAVSATLAGTVAMTGVITPVHAQEGTFTLNLKNADIHSLI